MVLGTQKKLLVLALAAIMLVGCGGKEDRKAKYLERGKAFIAEENWDKARVEIRNVLQIDPKDAEAYYLMGRIEERKQEWLNAFGNYSKAVELDPELIDARSQLAKFYMLQASSYQAQEIRDAEATALGQAQTEINEILKRDSKHAGARTLHAMMLLREGKTDEALVLVEGVVKDSPSSGDAADLLASLYEQADRLADAEKVLSTAATMVDEPILLKLHLAQLYARAGKLAEAEQVMRELVAEKPDEFDYRLLLGQFLAQTDQAGKAEAVMREAIAADPKDVRRQLLLADLLTATQTRAAGIDYLKGAITQDPELSELYFGLAKLYEQEKRTDEAKQVYEGMVEHYRDEPPGLIARNHLAAYAAVAGDMDAAGKLVDYILIKNPKDSEALQMKGRLALQRSDFETAVASFRSVLKEQPDSVPVLHLLAEAQLRKGDIELAGDNLRHAVEIAPQNADARIKFARYLIAKKELVRALEQIDTVLDKDPNNADAIAARSEVLAAKGDMAAVKVELAKLKEAAPDSVEASLGLARVYMAEGNEVAAMTEVDEVLARDEKNLAALLMKTGILATSNDVVNLEVAIKRLKTLLPENPEGYFRMGRLLRAKGDAAGALKEYEQAYLLADDTGKAEILHDLINTQLVVDQPGQALDRLKALLREEPEHKAANGLLGIVEMARKDYKSAEVAFAKQIQINPNNAAAYAQLSSAHEQQGNKAGAVAAFEQGLGVLKDNLNLQMGLAGVHERQGNIDAAVELYEKVLTKQSDNAIAVNNLAALLADHRTDEKSLARAKELAAMLEPVKQPALRDTLGWVHYRTGDYAKAVEVLEGVVNAAPKAAIFQYHLGMAYAKAGDKANAKATLTKALELGDFAGADEARKMLDSL